MENGKLKVMSRKYQAAKVSFWAMLLLVAPALPAQVDTSDIRYKVGYEIGSWLPFIILAGLFIVMLVMARRRSEKKE